MAKYDFDLLVRYIKMLFCTLYDSYIVNPYKTSLVRTGSGTSWAIRTMDFATPVSVAVFGHSILINLFINFSFIKKDVQ